MSNIIKQLQDADGNNIYPLAYAMGGVKMDLLWTNPQPTTARDTFTITQDLSESDLFFVSIKATTTSDVITWFLVIKSQERQKLLTASDYIYYRNITSVTDSGMTFETGYVAQTYGSVSANTSRAIPLKVYGIKFSWVVPTSVQGLQYVEV